MTQPPPTRVAVTAAALGADLRQGIELARRLGFRGMQLDGSADPLNQLDDSASGRRELLRLLAGGDVRLVSLSADIGARGLLRGADVDRALARADRVMALAAPLQAPMVCIDLGPLPPAPPRALVRPAVTAEMAGLLILPESASAPPAPPRNPAPPPDPALAGDFDAALADLGRRADRYGVTLALRCGLAGFDALERALRSASCPWFGVDLDPVSLLQDDRDADEIFSAVGPLIRHVRGRDATVGAERRTRPAIIGRGDVDWARLASLLDDAHYPGWITIDPVDLPDRLAAARAGLAWLSTKV